MPNFPWPGRRDADASLDGLLARGQAPEDLAAELQPAADVIAALRAAPASDELAGEAAALAVFRHGVSSPASRSRRRRPTLLGSILSAKVAAAAAAAFVVGFGGVAAAAYADKLPAPIQNLAHHVVHAVPAARHGSSAASSTSAEGRQPGHRQPGHHQPGHFRRHHHWRWQGCWPVHPRPSVSPSSSVSPTATPTPTPTPGRTCPPVPHRSWPPLRRHHHRWPTQTRQPFPHHGHFPHHRRPVRHRQPAPHASWTPSPRPSASPSEHMTH
jgi:hypothetical protein